MGGGEEECLGRYLPTKQPRLGSQGATKARGLVLCLPASVLTTKLGNVLGKAPHPPQPPHSGFVPTRRHSNLSVSLACYQSVCVAGLPAWPLCALVEVGHAPGSQRRTWDNGLAGGKAGAARRSEDKLQPPSRSAAPRQGGPPAPQVRYRFKI